MERGPLQVPRVCLQFAATLLYGAAQGIVEFATSYLALYTLVLACVLLGSTIANALPSLELAQVLSAWREVPAFGCLYALHCALCRLPSAS